MSSLEFVRGKTVSLVTENTQVENEGVRLHVKQEVLDLKNEILNHSGLKNLQEFSRKFQSRPLSNYELKIFFASVGAFFLEIPPGILRLASRITDEWMTIEPLKATEKGARVLFAAVDEFGLNNMEKGLLPTHHQLFLDMVKHWGISTTDLSNTEYILPAAAEFGRFIAEYYRNRTILEGLGVHVTIETTALVEFGAFLQGFQKFYQEYNLQSQNDSVLNFWFIHMDVEDSHGGMGLEMINLYCADRPELLNEARTGINAFMESYSRLYAEINEKLYS